MSTWEQGDTLDLPSLGKVVGEWVCITRARHDAEQAVVEAAKESRAAEKEATKLGRQTGYGTPRAVHASRALDRAVDALSTSQRDRQEASECDHWMHKLDLPRGTSMSFTTEAHEDLLAHRQVCPLLARGSSPSSSTEEKGQR